MPNMSYCRFENTAADVKDCLDAIHDNDLDEMSEYEIQGFVDFIDYCQDVVAMFPNDNRKELLEFIKGCQTEGEE